MPLSAHLSHITDVSNIPVVIVRGTIFSLVFKKMRFCEFITK